MGVFVYRELDVVNMKKALLSAAGNSAMVLLMISASGAFSWIMTAKGVAAQLG